MVSFAHALPEHRRSLSLDDQRRGRDKAKEQAATTSVQAATAEDLSCSAAACGQQSNLALGRGAGGGSRQEEQARCVQAEHKREHHDEALSGARPVSTDRLLRTTGAAAATWFGK